MDTIIRFAPLLAILMWAGCSNQRYVSSETDDIYYSKADRTKEIENEFAKVEEVSGESYQGNDQVSNDYFNVGSASQQGDQNPNAALAYTDQATEFNQGAAPEAQLEQDGAVINNFYGNTTYSEGDYYEDSYASRLRRFDNTNIYGNHGYYDPFFTDPFWNYGMGWSAWNRPAPGLQVGWNSWNGWNVGYNWGWGNPYNGWGNSWGGYCYDPFLANGYRPGWGWGGPYNNWGNQWGPGWGNPYGGGYWAGYNNGINDGLSLSNSRARQYGPRVGGRGGAFTPRNTGQTRTQPSNQNRMGDAPMGRVLVNNSDKTPMRAGSSPANVNDRGDQAGLKGGSRVFQASSNQEIAQNQNVKSREASMRYQGQSSPNNYRADSRTKYQSNNMARTENSTMRHQPASKNQNNSQSRVIQNRQQNQASQPSRTFESPNRTKSSEQTRTTPNNPRAAGQTSTQQSERPRTYQPAQTKPRNPQVNRPSSGTRQPKAQPGNSSRKTAPSSTPRGSRVTTPSRSTKPRTSPSQPSRSSTPSRPSGGSYRPKSGGSSGGMRGGGSSTPRKSGGSSGGSQMRRK